MGAKTVRRDQLEQYLVDKKGHKQAVVLSVREYEGLIEDIADLQIIAERKHDPLISPQELRRRLK